MTTPGTTSRSRYTEAQTTRWLAWMARNLQRHDQTVFLIEQLQVSWLSDRLQRLAFSLLSLTFEVILHGLIAGFFALLVADDPACRAVITWCGAFSGLVFGLIYSLTRGKDTIELTGRLRWSWSYFRKNLFPAFRTGAIRGALGGMVVAVLLTIAMGLSVVVLGEIVLALTLIGGLVGMISMGLKNTVPAHTTRPNEGIIRSLRIGFIRGLAWGLIMWGLGALFFYLQPGSLDWAIGNCVIPKEDWLLKGMLVGLVVGLPMGSFRGVMASVRHYSLRLLIYVLGYGPRDYADFLDYAADELRFVQRVGGGYIFIHRMLLEHFAARAEEDLAPQPAASVAAA